MLSPCYQRHKTGLPSAQTLPPSGARAPALVVPSCLLSSQVSSLRTGSGLHLSCHQPAVPARAGSPASRPFPDHKANGSFSSLGAACCACPRLASGERGDSRVPFLKALSDVEPRFSLRQRGATAKRISLHVGIFQRAAETSLGIQQQIPHIPF